VQSDVVVTTTQFGPARKQELEAMIRALGGGFQNHFDGAVSHVVALDVSIRNESEKLKAARERQAEAPSSVAIVTCGWIEVTTQKRELH